MPRALLVAQLEKPRTSTMFFSTNIALDLGPNV